MIPNHTSSTHTTHTTIFGWMILITMMPSNNNPNSPICQVSQVTADSLDGSVFIGMTLT